MLKQGKPKPTPIKNESVAPCGEVSSTLDDEFHVLHSDSYFKKEFEDALQAAFDHMNDDKIEDESAVDLLTANATKGKKKKQKNKGKLLFSTGAAFAPGLH